MPAAADIVLGQIVNSRGDWSDNCRDFSAGARVYLDGLNARGGINGERVVLAEREEGASASDTVQIARTLVEQQRAVALFGLCGGMAARDVAASPWFRSAGVAMLAPQSGALALRGAQAGEVYHIRASDADEADKLATTLLGFGLRRVALIYGADEPGRAGKMAFERALSLRGVQPLLSVALAGDGSDAAALAQRIGGQAVQAVMLTASTLASAAMVAELRRVLPGVMIFATSGINHATLADYLGSREAAQGVVIATLMPSPYFAVTPIAREHIRQMRQFRDEPPSHATLEGYVAARLAVEAIRRGGRRPDSMVRVLAGLGAVDVGGYQVDIGRGKPGSAFVDVAVVSKGGQLLN
ncbi:ABC transporter substrate-binding protein [Chitinimonas lacunae]|uniref:ABC transporter substrate-binding protein n=1 Tax=Chitinimonas lacunae TaxID=1963018 RepID=A0ABV8MQH2_9NEIS